MEDAKINPSDKKLQKSGRLKVMKSLVKQNQKVKALQKRVKYIYQSENIGSLLLIDLRSSLKGQMFSLCKTVKIYQTINHYHRGDSSACHLVDSHQIKYLESSSPTKTEHLEDQRLQTVESRSSAPRRTGISLSIRENSQKCPSPAKGVSLTKSKKDAMLASHTNSSAGDSLKLRTTRRDDCESPRIVESKITWGEMSPRPHHEGTQIDSPNFHSEEDFSMPPFLTLKKQCTGTTANDSHRGSDPKIQMQASPLKHSSFLRSSNRSKPEETLRNSLEYSLRNTLEMKLSGSRLPSAEASSSLLRLSCSSYSQAPFAPILAASDFSQSCSLELKKEESFLKEYANEVNQSIILRNGEKEMKYVRSNYDLLQEKPQGEFKPTQSNIIDRDCDSPVRRLKKKYGQNFLNIYQKDTIVSKSIASRSNQGEKAPIIDESIIIRHSVEQRFQVLQNRVLSKPHYRLSLAVEEQAGLLVSLKEVSSQRMNSLTQELAVYREIEERGVQGAAVSQLYQLYTHGDIQVMVKEPHEYNLEEYVEKYHSDFALPSWEFILQAIQVVLRCTLTIMASHRLFLCRFIGLEDIVCSYGQWRLHSADMFSVAEGEETAIPVEQALKYLRDEVITRIHARTNHSQ